MNWRKRIWNMSVVMVAIWNIWYYKPRLTMASNRFERYMIFLAVFIYMIFYCPVVIENIIFCVIFVIIMSFVHDLNSKTNSYVYWTASKTISHWWLCLTFSRHLIYEHISKMDKFAISHFWQGPKGTTNMYSVQKLLLNF